jgi:hypothetical protein
MTEDEACRLIIEGMQGPQSLMRKLRRQDGFDEPQWLAMKAAFEFLIEAWRDRDSVPKSLALALSDIRDAFEIGGNRYEPNLQTFVEEVGCEVMDYTGRLYGSPHQT